MRTAQVKQREPADERITARIPSSTRLIIERAAALYGASINQFIVQAAVDRANEVLQRMEVLKLADRDTEIFLQALANPPQPEQTLLDAISAHTRAVESQD